MIRLFMQQVSPALVELAALISSPRVWDEPDHERPHELDDPSRLIVFGGGSPEFGHQAGKVRGLRHEAKRMGSGEGLSVAQGTEREGTRAERFPRKLAGLVGLVTGEGTLRRRR